jgi:hypothetical protein
MSYSAQLQTTATTQASLNHGPSTLIPDACGKSIVVWTGLVADVSAEQISPFGAPVTVVSFLDGSQVITSLPLDVAKAILRH